MLVTGASRGIGAATAVLAADAGFRVCVNYRRDSAAAERVVRAIVAKGGDAIRVSADVSDEAAVQEMFAESENRLGALTALVNNAGILDVQASFGDIDGVVFASTDSLPEIEAAADQALEREASVLAAIEQGSSLSEQLAIEEFLELREKDPGADFNAHLSRLGKAI